MLGAPIGDKTFIKSFSQEKLNKAQNIIDKIKQLKYNQTVYCLLKYCASFCRFVYLIRTTPKIHIINHFKNLTIK